MDEQNDNINKKEEEIPKIDTKIKVNDTTGNNTNIINNIIINIEKEKNEKILDNNNMKKDNKKIKSQDSKKKHENKYFVINNVETNDELSKIKFRANSCQFNNKVLKIDNTTSKHIFNKDMKIVERKNEKNKINFKNENKSRINSNNVEENANKNEGKNEIINQLSEDEINLKNNLCGKKIGKYLEEQKEKYLKIYKDNEILNNDYFLKSSFGLNFHSSRNSNFAVLKKSSDNLKNYFNNFNGNYDKNFGFVVLKNIAYFYLTDAEEQEKVLLYDCSKIKKIDYGTTDKISDSFSLNSYSLSNKSNSNEDMEIKYNLFCGKKNWTDFFDLCFGLEHLPSIFFSVKINEPKKNINNTFKNYFYPNTVICGC